MDYIINIKNIQDLNPSENKDVKLILSQYYKDSDSLLLYLTTTNSHIYLLNLEEETIGFYMYSTTTINQTTIVHLGQSAIKKQYTGSNTAFLLYKRQYADLIKLKLKGELIVYATTANESVFNYSFQIYKNVAPCINGSYSEEDLEKLNIILKKKEIKSDSYHPFVVRNYSLTSRYNKPKINKPQKDIFFNNLKLDESKGDRLIIILKP